MRKKTDKTSQTPPRVPFQLRLRTSKSSKNTMARLGRSFAKGEIDEKTFRLMTWFMNLYLGYLKNDEAIDFDARLTAIERTLQKPKDKGGLKVC